MSRDNSKRVVTHDCIKSNDYKGSGESHAYAEPGKLLKRHDSFVKIKTYTRCGKEGIQLR